MNDKGIKTRALFRFENLCHRCRIQGVGRQPVNRLGRQGNDFACAQKLDRSFGAERSRYDFGLQRFSRAARTRFVASSALAPNAVRCPIFRRGRASCLP